MKWTWLLIVAAMLGCSQISKRGSRPTEDGLRELRENQDQVVQEFERGNQLLDSSQYAEAAKVYDDLIVKYPVNQLDVLILFNSGIAHLQALDCSTAADRFRRAIRKADKNSPSLQARARLRMADVYTCLGEDHKAITNLLELYEGGKSLPTEISQAEIPAKLAAAYARNGNNKEAEKYFRLAEKGLLRAQAEATSNQERATTLSRTLFMMGNISQLSIQTMSSDDYFATVRSLQKYLYKAVEFNHPEWSALSADQLAHAYENTWQYIDRVPLGKDSDPALAQRTQKLEQLRVAGLAQASLQRLFELRIADPNEPEFLTNFMKRMRGQELKVRNYVATNIIGTALTPEALQNEGLKRSGRVLNPDPLLEQEAKQRQLKKKK